MGTPGVEASDGSYRFGATVEVGAAPDEVWPWLVEPDLLVRWVPGATGWSVGADGGVSCVIGSTGNGAHPVGYVGGPQQTTDAGVVRTWALPATFGDWHREVGYTLSPSPGGTTVAVVVTTTIPGGRRRTLAAGAKVEAAALVGALDHLAAQVAGSGGRPRRRLLSAPPSAGPL